MERPRSPKGLLDRSVMPPPEILPVYPQTNEVDDDVAAAAAAPEEAVRKSSRSPKSGNHVDGVCHREGCEPCLRAKFRQNPLANREVLQHAFDGLVDMYTPAIFPDKIYFPKLEPLTGMKDIFYQLVEDITAEQRLVVCYATLFFRGWRQSKTLHAFAYGVRATIDETEVVARYAEVTRQDIPDPKEFLDQVFDEIDQEFRIRVQRSQYSTEVFDRYRRLRWSNESHLAKDVVYFLTATILQADYCQHLLKLWVMYDGTFHIAWCKRQLEALLEKKEDNPETAYPFIVVLYSGLQAYDLIEENILYGHQWPKVTRLREVFVRSVLFFLHADDFPDTRRRMVEMFRMYAVEVRRSRLDLSSIGPALPNPQSEADQPPKDQYPTQRAQNPMEQVPRSQILKDQAERVYPPMEQVLRTQMPKDPTERSQTPIEQLQRSQTPIEQLHRSQTPIEQLHRSQFPRDQMERSQTPKDHTVAYRAPTQRDPNYRDPSQSQSQRDQNQRDPSQSQRDQNQRNQT